MSIASEQVPGVYRRRIGEVLVTALSDGEVVLPLEVLLGVTAAEREAVLRAGGRRPPFQSSINVFLLQWPERSVLVDTGTGKAFGDAAGRLPANLKAAGIAPDDIDAIAMTHLHADHFGGLLNDSGARAFPNAELWVAETEMAYWQDDAMKAAAPEERRGTFDMARTKTRPFADKMHRFQFGEIMPGLEAIALPGHTPGHTGYMLRSAGETLLIWGDVVHVPVLQAARPEVGTRFDTDPAQAIQTRLHTFERAVTEDLLVTGMHMSFPGFARITRAGEAYAVQPDVWSDSP